MGQSAVIRDNQYQWCRLFVFLYRKSFYQLFAGLWAIGIVSRLAVVDLCDFEYYLFWLFIECGF